jgi:hypothetical protein
MIWVKYGRKVLNIVYLDNILLYLLLKIINLPIFVIYFFLEDVS